MSISNTERPARQLPPWSWGSQTPLEWQIFFTFSIGVGLLVAFHLLLPESSEFARRTYYVLVHEASHAGVALLQGGEVHSLQIRPDGSGEALVSVANPLLSAAAGPVLPAWLAAGLLALAATRRANGLALLTIGMALYLAAQLLGAGAGVYSALLGLAAAAGLIGLAPAGPLVKSAALVFFAGLLGIGVIDALPELATAARIIPAATGEQTSDVAKIAASLGISDRREVPRLLFMLMASGALTSALAVATFVLRHRNPWS